MTWQRAFINCWIAGWLGARSALLHLPDGSQPERFADLGALTDAAEARLRQLGVRAGDRVLVVARTARACRADLAEPRRRPGPAA